MGSLRWICTSSRQSRFACSRGSHRLLRICQVSRLIRRSLRFRHPCHRKYSRRPSNGRGSSPVWQVPHCLLGKRHLVRIVARRACAVPSGIHLLIENDLMQPICNQLSQGNMACSNASLYLRLYANSITRMEGPLHDRFADRLRKIVLRNVRSRRFLESDNPCRQAASE
jgi:hypothetical protein